MENLQWYVLQCQSRKEAQVHKQLQAKEINTYYPKIKIKPTNPRASKVRPLFPGYVFVQTELESVRIGDLNWLPGVIRPIKFGDYFATVTDEFIESLREKIVELDARGGLIDFKKGDRIRITHGPLAGYEAIFDAYLSKEERVLIFLDMLGKMSKAQIGLDSIEKISEKR